MSMYVYSGHALSYTKLVHRLKETNISNEHNRLKKSPLAGSKPVGYLQAWPRSWTRIHRETTPAKWSERDLNPWPPDFKSSAQTTRPRCLPTALYIIFAKIFSPICHVIGARSRGCPIWTICNWTPLIGYPRDFHVNYERFNAFLGNVFYSFQNLTKALRAFSLKRSS